MLYGVIVFALAVRMYKYYKTGEFFWLKTDTQKQLEPLKRLLQTLQAAEAPNDKLGFFTKPAEDKNKDIEKALKNVKRP
jgi:hypothetical protein